ncbi:MAG TPA: RNA polymerase sigma-70 factor [Bacteroidetes bacterium]|nr:RNA polymerase sigma-70 factor [Bacteroidota bacterium]
MSSGAYSDEDYRLIKALQKGDIFAFNELFLKYSHKVYNFAIKHMEHEEDVKDLVQDVFIKIWNKRKDIDEKQSFNGYLFAITLNMIRKYFRKKVKDYKLVDRWLENTKSYSEETKLTIEYNSFRERTDKILNELPPKRKTVFILSREQGLSAEDIARVMNISKKTVENHLNLALRYLRKKLVGEIFLLIFFFIFL